MYVQNAILTVLALLYRHYDIREMNEGNPNAQEQKKRSKYYHDACKDEKNKV